MPLAGPTACSLWLGLGQTTARLWGVGTGIKPNKNEYKFVRSVSITVGIYVVRVC